MSKKKSIQESGLQIQQDSRDIIIDVLLIVFSVVFFGIAPLLNFKPAYDYTIIKDILGILSVLIFGIALYMKKDAISINTGGFITGTVFFGWLLIGYFYAP